MLKRKAEAALAAWRGQKTKHALLITGARQVGKTYIAEAFAHDHYKHVAKFDMIDNVAARESFAKANGADDLMLRMSVASPIRLVPGETLIFVDEVQECPEIVTLIKYLVGKGEYDFILSGSLLGVELENVRSNPTGYVMELEMFPLDFEEFCWANGVPEDVPDAARASVEALTPVPDFVHERLMELFHRFLLVGGMPDAVVTYLAENNIDRVRDVHDGIVNYYGRDITKYAPKDRRLIIRNIYDLIPSELLRQNKRFRISSIDNAERFKQVQNEFLWLTKAGVALAAYSVSAPVSPLLLSESRNMFKMYMSDTGLLTSRYPKDASVGLIDGSPQMNLGGVYENFAAQELTAHGFRLRYYISKKVGEIDFLAEGRDGLISAIEIKSGRNYKVHKALTKALATPMFDVSRALVYAETNVEAEADVVYLPVYALSFLKP
jgi:predicted AAA+ superfamily ATPase